jgi:hypothetical protein
VTFTALSGQLRDDALLIHWTCAWRSTNLNGHWELKEASTMGLPTKVFEFRWQIVIEETSFRQISDIKVLSCAQSCSVGNGRRPKQ